MSSAVDLGDPPGATRGNVGHPRSRREGMRTLLRGAGQTLITVGLIALLFVVYELWVTDVLSARQQGRLDQQIHEQWAVSDGRAAGDRARRRRPATRS